jgi:hypothetical protein
MDFTAERTDGIARLSSGSGRLSCPIHRSLSCASLLLGAVDARAEEIRDPEIGRVLLEDRFGVRHCHSGGPRDARARG